MNPPPPSEERIFQAAAALPAHERGTYLDSACGDRLDLRARLERLLASREAPGFMDAPPLDPDIERELARLKPEEAGERIGLYKLLQQIGEGGFGVVWMAEQEQPVRRRVALKIIKMGMDTKEVIARFEQERQALAMMEHPNIAKVFDAGATQYGRPFFVMELVRGVKITDYCDQQELATAERLALFIHVCQAVQHAHQKGIIHRDLKPSNILVTLHDGVPVPKVIDFGVAKATQARLTERTLFTQFQQMVGTPLYMSPEQAEMSGLDIDTRSDIYSLGVLLYELLTGRTPFDAETMQRAGLDEIRRIIREQEPVKPSTALQTLAADARTDVARHRQSDGAKLTGLLRGDLDWIVMKALEKDRVRRYDSATALAEDLRRHLTFEPVLARPPSRLYRFRRMVKRNKLAFAAGTLIPLTLLVGFVVSSLLYLVAESRLKTSNKTAAFLIQMLRDIGSSAAQGRDPTMLQEILEKSAARLDKDLKGEPEVASVLRNNIASVYVEFRDYAAAESLYRQALAMERKSRGAEHREVAISLHNLAVVLDAQGNHAEAEAMHREALAMNRKLLGTEHRAVATTLNSLANTLDSQGRLEEAEALHREALAMRKSLLGPEHPEVAASLADLAGVLSGQSRHSEAETMHREALAMRKMHLGLDHRDVASSRAGLAAVLAAQGKHAAAEAIGRDALAMQRKLLGAEHPDVAVSLHNLTLALEAQGKHAEAESRNRELLEVRRMLLGAEHSEVAHSLSSLASVLYAQRKDAEAETMYRQALAMRRKLLGAEHRDVAGSLGDLANVLATQGKDAEAEPIYREALAMQRKVLGAEHSDVAQSLCGLASVLRAPGQLAEAETMAGEALAMRRKLLGAEHPRVASVLYNLGCDLRDQDKFAKAEAAHREALAMQRKLLGGEHSDTAPSLINLADALSAQKKFAEARPLAEEAVALCRSHPDWDAKTRRSAFTVLDEILVAVGDQAAHEALQREIAALPAAK